MRQQRGSNVNTSGSQPVTLSDSIAGEDIANDVHKIQHRFTPTYISTATTTLVKTGVGVLGRVVVNGGTAGTIIGYDNTAASGTVLFSFDSTNALMSYIFDVTFSVGLTVVTSAATKVTIAAA